ncbi:MAG: DUF5777 family beta-barrel protein [Bacteroidetes bacterium]|nr:DUF5777 family beta-barrel protein [Bacteroidota bacterium]
MIKKLILSILISGLFLTVKAQDDDLLKSLDDGQTDKNKHEPISSTFKGSRLVNFHTVETLGKRTLDFRISHRFGNISDGLYNAYGVDGPASIRIGFEYSYDGKLVVGVGRTSVDKLYDGFLKYRFLRQTTDNFIPVSVTALTGMNVTTQKDLSASATHPDKYGYMTSRFSYVNQLMIARAFNKNLSVQIAPTHVHFNLVEKLTDKNDIFATVFMARYKVSGSVALTAEYALRMNTYSLTQNTYHNSFGAGIDIETGGHVFQIHVTNSMGIEECQNIPYTTGDISKLNLKLGFNVSRWFSI